MSRSKRATKASPSPESLTTRRRKNRGFTSLEASCRIHRRAARRSLQSRTHYGKVHEAGAKVTGEAGSFVHNAGGSIHFW